MPLYNNKQNYNKTSLIVYLFLGFVFFLASTASSSLLMLLVVKNEWDIAYYLSSSLLDFTLNTFPFLLLIPVIVSLLLSVTFFRKTLLAKPFSLYLSIIILFFSSIVIAMILFYLGVTNGLYSFVKQFSLYAIVEKNRQEIWQNPDLGLLSGRVATITDLNDFLLIDNNSKTWNIESRNPKLVDKDILSTGKFIKLIGRKSDNNTFEAKEIRP